MAEDWMSDWFAAVLPAAAATPWVHSVLGLLLLAVLAGLAQYLTRSLLVRALGRLHGHADGALAVLLDRRVLWRIAQISPWVVIYLGIEAVPELGEASEHVIGKLAAALMVLFVARAIFKVLDVALEAHDADPRRHARVQTRSIKAYVQLAQLVIVIATVVVTAATLADKSPLIVLSGFGALSAVLMLVFQDTIKSLVAGLLIERNDMLRVGDWVQMRQVSADGEVVDIALNTVKVQNWDKTIVTIPTWRLIDDSFTNWRGMRDSGGRRIKRELLIDVSSIGFLSEADAERLGRIALIADYMREKAEARRLTHEQRLRELGAELASEPANQRRLTNIGTFRAYVTAYLRVHPGVHPGMTQMVRQMQPRAEGVPLEVYCFAGTIAWVDYESIQSDIFDHLLAILAEFGLRAYQRPSDASVQRMAGVDG